jgi:hypothetical protein
MTRTLLVLGVLFSPLLVGCSGRGDAMAPMVAIREPRSGATSSAENRAIIGYAFDDEGIHAIRVNGLNLLSNPAYASEYGKRLVEFRFFMTNGSEGDYSVTIEAEDTRGNVTVLPYQLILDSTPPTLDFISVVNLSNGRKRIEGVARDNTLVTSVLINGVPLAFTPAPEHTFRVDVATVDGDEVVVQDAAGNIVRKRIP